GLPDVTLAYTYASGDLVGTQATIGETADFHNAYARDSFGRLTRVTQTDVAGGNPVADKRADFAYTDAGQLATIIRSMDIVAQEPSAIVTTTFSYDPSLGWLAGLVHEINNTNEDVVEYAYTHQPDGQIETIVLDRDVDDVQSSETYDFDYDQQGQLTQVDYTGTGAGVDESYQYGANGNRTGATVGSSSSVYTPGAYNRLESVDDGTTVTVFGYDPEGNLVLRFVDADQSGSLTTGDTEVTEYVWDHRNRLVGVYSFDTFDDYATNPSQEVEYSYDYLNRLVARAVDGDREYFVYDHDASTNWGLKNLSTSKEGTIPFGANPATDAGQIVLQLDETGEPTHRYLWGPAVDMLLADEAVNSGPDQTPGTADDVRWTLGDHQNSVRDIVVYDDNGTPGNPIDDQWKIGNHVTYDAWGNTVAETDAAISGLFGWTGRPRDKLTGLQTNGNRWYDAVLAHWQSEDPIGFAAGDANLYRYCGNDPVNRIDPNGCRGEHWWNDGWIDWFNPLAYPVSWGYALGEKIGDACYHDNIAENSQQSYKRHLQIATGEWQEGDFTKRRYGYGNGPANTMKTLAEVGAEADAVILGGGFVKPSAPRGPVGPSKYGPVPSKEAPGTALVPKSTVELGKWGEARLAADLGYQGVKPGSAFKTSMGNRFVDRLVNRVAHEAKAGINVGLTGGRYGTRMQALKDAELIAKGRIDAAVWHFYQGAQQELLDFLTEHGIQYVVH
ncbi:MAG: hypothetical protein GX621_07630, partial [Pirellulaceae bacterium]|nr:hypothetical protein [Pirellulaceae bacterium]